MEYGCVGFSEESAMQKYGKQNIEVYHNYFSPLELTLTKRDENKCYIKLVCVKSEGVSQIIIFILLAIMIFFFIF